MHPKLANFCWYTAMDILASNELSISFLEDIELIPKKTQMFPCPKCGKQMKSNADKGRKLGVKWRCHVKKCLGRYNPLQSTIFESMKINFNEILAIIFEFIRETPVTHAHKRLCMWRESRGDKVISITTVVYYYSLCRKVCQIIASRENLEEFEIIKAAESHYRKFRIPKTLSEGEQISRFLKDIDLAFPRPDKSIYNKELSLFKTLVDSDMSNKVVTILNNDESSSPQKDVVSSPEKK